MPWDYTGTHAATLPTAGRAFLIEHATVCLTDYCMTPEELAMCITCMPELFDSLKPAFLAQSCDDDILAPFLFG